MSATTFNPRSTCCTHTPSIPENKLPCKGLATLAILIGGVLITKKLTSRLGKVSSAFGTVGLIATIWSQHFPSREVDSSNDFSEIEQKVYADPKKAPCAFHQLLRLLLKKEMNELELEQASQCLSTVCASLKQDIRESVQKILWIDFDNLSTELCRQGLIPSQEGCTGLNQADQTSLITAKKNQLQKIGEILDCLEKNDFNVRFEETKRCLQSPDYNQHKKLFQLFMFITLCITEGPQDDTLDNVIQNLFENMEDLDDSLKIGSSERTLQDLLIMIADSLTSNQVIQLFKEAQNQNRALHCRVLCELMIKGNHRDETFQPLQDFEKRQLLQLPFGREEEQELPLFKSDPLTYTAKNVISKVLELISKANPDKSFADIVNPEKSFVDIGGGSSEGSLDEPD